MVAIVVLVLLFTGLLVGCGGGGGGGGTPPAAPAFTNLAGTRWDHTDTASAVNTCGVPVGDTDSFVLHVVSQSGNTITFYDERAGAANAVNGSMSGYVVTFNGSRFAVGGCFDMTANYNITVNAAGNAYSGTGTITCLDAPACSIPVTITGTLI
jgi:hypothetical protein